jgi:hypothetical protein
MLRMLSALSCSHGKPVEIGVVGFLTIARSQLAVCELEGGGGVCETLAGNFSLTLLELDSFRVMVRSRPWRDKYFAMI